MRITYSKHACDRMTERDITDEDVRECLSNPVQRIQNDKKHQYKGMARGRILKVAVAPDRDSPEDTFIVTVTWEDNGGR